MYKWHKSQQISMDMSSDAREMSSCSNEAAFLSRSPSINRVSSSIPFGYSVQFHDWDRIYVVVHSSLLDLCLGTSLLLPRWLWAAGPTKSQKDFIDDLLYDIDISFGNNPTSVTSFTEYFTPKMTRLCTADSFSPIMVINLSVYGKSCVIISRRACLYVKFINVRSILM